MQAAAATTTTKTNLDDDAATGATAANGTKTTTSISFVITGFGPFGGVKENPTTVIVRRLDSYLRSLPEGTPGGDSEETEPINVNPNDNKTSHKAVNGPSVADLVDEYVTLETSARDVNETMDRIRRNRIEVAAREVADDTTTRGTSTRKILLLHLGVGRSEGFRLELCAYNDASFRIPDQRGFRPSKEPIVSDPSKPVGHCYETSLDLETLQKQMQKDFPSISTVVSTDPGRFVCNYVYCKSLEASLPYSGTNDSPRTKSDDPPLFMPSDTGTNTKSGNEQRDKKGSADTDFSCQSLFLHVPHFATVGEEEQLAYVACLLENLAAQCM
jgi:pyroglutamyl-peptidase